ncbi:hypothetical protein DSO57_1021858 [Entomophthora muscae]|uniref:Uncharacterized protein n=1 Tax=Entomophthora muscae TaxID=34485 RepID=A0ACC2S5H0_9FUNG|nr:hypothetical protein DSO57_1021858 [Entomophthora muscae]
MLEVAESLPLLDPRSARDRALNHPITDNAFESKVARFLWTFSVTTFTLSTILLFFSPFVLSYLEYSGHTSRKPFNQVKGTNKSFFNQNDHLTALSLKDFKQFSGPSFYNSFQEPKETFLVKFKVKATRASFLQGNYSSVQLVILGTTSPRRSLTQGRFPKVAKLSASEADSRQELIAASILDFSQP